MTIVRWLLVFPAALLASIIAQEVIIFGHFLSGDYGYPAPLVRLLNAYVGTYVFIIAGVHTAPAYPTETSVALAVLYSVGTALSFHFDPAPGVFLAIGTVVMVIGAVHGCVSSAKVKI
jgi:hypothetical protein